MTVRELDETTLRALEERALNAWPALQTALCDGWLLRFAGGHTKRANSANALFPGPAFTEVLRAADALYRANGLPPVFRLSPLAGPEPEAMLSAAGFRRADDSLVMTAPIPPDAQPDPGLSLSPVPSDAWSDGFAQLQRIRPERRVIHDRMLASIRHPAAFAVLMEEGRPAAYGIGVLERGMVGLFDIVTDPVRRRRGFATRLVTGLLSWGRAQGAESAYLQVLAGNEPALALYRRLGFREAYRYHYRIAPR
jgi:GNAT superfamily N-acetyltransferase